MIQTREFDDGIDNETFKAEFDRLIGGSNWVLGRRTTTRMVRRYGEDVIRLTYREYKNAVRVAYLNLTQGYD